MQFFIYIYKYDKRTCLLYSCKLLTWCMCLIIIYAGILDVFLQIGLLSINYGKYNINMEVIYSLWKCNFLTTYTETWERRWYCDPFCRFVVCPSQVKLHYIYTISYYKICLNFVFNAFFLEFMMEQVLGQAFYFVEIWPKNCLWTPI